MLGAIVGLALLGGNVGAIYALSNIAIGVAFVLMITWLATTTLARIAYFLAAIGWLLLALTSLVDLGLLGTVGVFVAIVGSVFAGVIVLTGHPFTRLAIIVFFVAMVLGAANLLLSQNGNVPSALLAAVVLLFGAALAASAVLILRKQ